LVTIALHLILTVSQSLLYKIRAESMAHCSVLQQ
jgi:hypothetical protein